MIESTGGKTQAMKLAEEKAYAEFRDSVIKRPNGRVSRMH